MRNKTVVLLLNVFKKENAVRKYTDEEQMCAGSERIGDVVSGITFSRGKEPLDGGLGIFKNSGWIRNPCQQSMIGNKR